MYQTNPRYTCRRAMECSVSILFCLFLAQQLFVQVKQQTLSDIAGSLGNLREELVNDFSNTDSSITQQVVVVHV